MTSDLSPEQITLRSRQLNPCDHLFWKCRGYSERPNNWEDILQEMGYYDEESDESCDDEESCDEEESCEEESEYDWEEDENISEEEDEEEYEHRIASNENNPNNDAFWRARGYEGRPDNWRAQRQLTFRSRQLNPCDHLFWKCRGYSERPNNWEDILVQMGYYDNDDEEEAECEEEEEYDEDEEYEEEEEYDEEEYEEHRKISNENNPNNDAYWKLRGYSERPTNWRDLI